MNENSDPYFDMPSVHDDIDEEAMWAEARDILEQGYKEHHEKLEREARELATVTNEKHDQEAA